MDMDTKKFIPIIIVIIAAVIAAVFLGLYFWRGQKKVQTPAPASTPAVLAVPQVTVQNNPIEKKVPEINPAEGANPFKYKNPLSK
ncbi:MAG: hypothetical protein HYV67_01685 [Candidatus Taylorbacteria bacterium]|nr:hypothetical protein [Candidatus Taylorbacteria bacterium]